MKTDRRSVARGIRTKRVYEPPAAGDGRRVLVDRLWPRGLSKAAAVIDAWVKAVAPSTPLRKWYGHDPAKWEQFRRRYFDELDANPEALAELRANLGKRAVTLLYSSKEPRLNNATALQEYLGSAPRRHRRPARGSTGARVRSAE